MEIRIKEKFENKVVAFRGGGNLPLGKRSQEDLVHLAIMAQQSKDPTLLELFEGNLPGIQDLQKFLVAADEPKKEEVKEAKEVKENKEAKETPKVL